MERRNKKKIVEAIKSAKTIAIFSHIRPDGDAIGSSSAMYLAMKSLNKDVDIYLDDRLPQKFDKVFTANDYRLSLDLDKKYDLVIALDSYPLSRLGKYSDYFSSHSNSVRIDHHATIDGYYAKYNYVDVDSSSSSEIVLDFLKLLNVKITPDIANCLYMGLICDCGCFKFQNTNENSFRAALKLLKYGADRQFVTYNFFQKKTKKQQEIEALILKNEEQHTEEIVSSFVDYASVKRFGVEKSDTPGLANMIIEVDNVKISFILFEEQPNKCVVSIRSFDEISAARVANSVGGGGHEHAAGAVIMNTSVENARKMVLSACIKEVEDAKLCSSIK